MEMVMIGEYGVVSPACLLDYSDGVLDPQGWKLWNEPIKLLTCIAGTLRRVNVVILHTMFLIY